MDWPLTQFRTYTITDAMAAGSPDALSAYNATIRCTDSVTGERATVAGDGPSWTIRIDTDHAYACTVTNAPGTGSYTVSKSSSPDGAVVAGETESYRVSVTNTGAVPYTAVNPASMSDDLSGVLDDASFDGTVTATMDGAPVEGASYSEPSQLIAWEGPLPVGKTVVVEYSVEVTGGGDGALVNEAKPDDPTGTCDDCSVENPVQSFRVVKSSTGANFAPGENVSYSVKVTNTGQVAYTAADPASFTDDLSDVLEHASYNHDANHGATFSDAVLSWSGSLAPGTSIVVTYSVTVDDSVSRDQHLRNTVVTPEGTGGSCPAGSTNADCSVELSQQSYTVSKTADKDTAAPGDTVTYTVTVKNTGGIGYTPAAPASFTDDLSRVLDDASYNDDASAGATVTSGTLSWAGPLPMNATKTVTYSVTVDSPETGDHLLKNGVAVADPTGRCDPDGQCVATTKVSSYSVVKKASSDRVEPGEVLSYTVTVTNVGRVAYTDDSPASFTDDLSGVLAHADYNNDADNGATVTGDVLSWAGPLSVGQTKTVRYSVTVHGNAAPGDTLTNAVVVPLASGSDCQAGSGSAGCSTRTAIDPHGGGTLPDTGSTVSALAGLLAAALVAVGGLLILARRRWVGRQSS